MENNYLASIEFTSLSTRIVVVSYFHGKLNVVAKVETPCFGYENGLIKDEELFEKSVNKAINEVDRLFKIKVDEVILCLPMINHKSYSAVVSNKVMTERQIIGLKQIMGVRSRIRAAKVNEDEILVDEVPLLYMLDEERVLRTPPINQQSSTISIKSSIHTLPKDVVNKIENILLKQNVKILGRELSINSGAFLTAEEYELENECIHINIGDEITNFGAYVKGNLLKSYQVNFGVSDLINYLTYSLKVSKEEAYKLFNSYFICNADYASNIVFDNQLNLSEKRISGIVLNKLVSGFDMIIEQFNKIKEENSFNDNVLCLVTGNLNDFEFFVSEFSEYSKFNVKEGLLNAIGIDSQCFINPYGAINNFIRNNKELVEDRINGKEDVEVTSEIGTTTVNLKIPTKSTGSKFKDIFDE